MRGKFQLSSLIPSGLVVVDVMPGDRAILITAKATAGGAACPLCNVTSRRVHSRYVRRVSDLPCAGRGVRLHLVARRFRCEQTHRRQQIFVERFDAGVAPARSRRTTRLDSIVHHLGLALGGDKTSDSILGFALISTNRLWIRHYVKTP